MFFDLARGQMQLVAKVWGKLGEEGGGEVGRLWRGVGDADCEEVGY